MEEEDDEDEDDEEEELHTGGDGSHVGHNGCRWTVFCFVFPPLKFKVGVDISSDLERERK